MQYPEPDEPGNVKKLLLDDLAPKPTEDVVKTESLSEFETPNKKFRKVFVNVSDTAAEIHEQLG